MTLPKGVIAAIVSNACGKDVALRSTYNQLGWREFQRTPCAKSDPLEVLADFIFHLCIEDGVYNQFGDPISTVMPRALAHFKLAFDVKRAGQLLSLLTSGDADSDSICELLRKLTSPAKSR